MQVINNDIYFESRKWGHFHKFIENENCTVKLISIKKGESMHLQYHKYRSEQWYVISGKIAVTKGIETSILIPNTVITISIGEKHKMEGIDDSQVLEIARGYFDEKDIVHL